MYTIITQKGYKIEVLTMYRLRLKQAFTHYKQTSSYMVFSIYELNDFAYVSKIKVH